MALKRGIRAGQIGNAIKLPIVGHALDWEFSAPVSQDNRAPRDKAPLARVHQRSPLSHDGAFDATSSDPLRLDHSLFGNRVGSFGAR